MKHFILIDSHAIIHRAYHALPPLTAPTGEPTHAVYGFTAILLRILRELKPDYIAAAFDLPGDTFRHVVSDRYKATRPETPHDLASQFEKVKEVLTAFGIPVFEKQGYEADDILGTLVKKVCQEKNLETMIVTSDMDMLQLVSPYVKIYTMRKGVSDTFIYDIEAVQKRYGFNPNQIIDFKALKGDSSDNIEGVKGIGEKTAIALIQIFGSIEEIYKELKKGTKKISPAISQKLKEGESNAFLSKELATIHNSVPIETTLDSLRRIPEDTQKIVAIFQKFGFLGLIKRFNEWRAMEKIRAVPQSFSFAANSIPQEKTSEILTVRTLKEFLSFISSAKKFACIIEREHLYIVKEKELMITNIAASLFKEKMVRKFFENNCFTCWDAKNIVHFLHHNNITIGPIDFDIMIASYLTGSFSRDFSYGAIVGRALGRPASPDVTQEFIHIFNITSLLEKKLEDENMQKVFSDIELPIIRILADMEERGVMVDAVFLKKLAKKINNEIKMITDVIYQQAGKEFNINSSRQLSHILFGVFNLNTSGLRKTAKGGVISTGAAELEKLKTSHPIVSSILNYRELAKLKTTYIDVLPALINTSDGRIHTTFNQTIALTGRLSSSDPNLQNIPIMSEHGKKIRRAFIAPKNYVFCSFDYSQIELRVAAHMADDKKMIEAFKKGFDIHRMTAAAIHGIGLEKVTPELRRAAKTLNFGILYGMGAAALAENTGMSYGDAKRFINDYFREFSGIRNYLDKIREFAETHGYVETLFGRRRYIPEIHSLNWHVKREAERMAINMPIQGTATGDIVKMAMIGVDRWIHAHGHENNVRMILQVHDELVFEIHKDEIKKVIPKIKEIMEHTANLAVPLVVDVKIGKNWGEQVTFERV